LTPKERALLHFLVENPRAEHSYTDLIVATWSDEERYHGVNNDSLHQVIRTLRLKIEPNPSQPVYVVNWRGKPEGGYTFFPEGRPR
jgi:DNA-binding response OmpR family regulator